MIVSNRLPCVARREEDGAWRLEAGSGGLVTALAPVLRNRGGIWIGWSGADEVSPELDRLLETTALDTGYQLKPVHLEPSHYEGFYLGFSNEVIWPLFHDQFTLCNFDPDYFASYREVNLRFAKVIKANLRFGDYVWVHDYHLMGVAQELRRMGVRSRIGFFLHIPFPPLDIFLKLPWRFQVLGALLEHDLIGLQTMRDRRNFLNCVRALIPEVSVQGKGHVVSLGLGERQVRVGAFPISIDFHEFANQAATQEVAERAWYLHENEQERQIILGVDRLDYSKGIPEKLEAFRNALIRYPELREKVVLKQVVVPSRVDIPRYRDLKTRIEGLVGQINGQFTSSGWVPIHYNFSSLERRELLAYYRTAEVALVTPLKDGMNLVCKEYCAASLEENCALILSEFAGAASQLHRWALLVNPHDREGVADAIRRALYMTLEERKARMQRLRLSVRKQNIYWWVDSFLDAAFARRLDNFPVVYEYLPRMKMA